MSTVRRQGIVLALAIVAVILGGALFPSAGLGTVPGGGSGPGLPGAADGADGESGAPTPDGAETPTDVATPSGTEAGTPADADTGDATDTPTATGSPTPTATATPTPSPTPSPTPTDEDDQSSLIVAAMLGAVVVAVVLAVLVVRGSAPGGGSAGRPGTDSGGDGTGTLPDVGQWRRNPLGLLARIPQLTMVALVGFASAMAELLGSLGRVGGGLVAGLDVALRSLGRGMAGLLDGFGRALTTFRLPDLSVPSVSGAFSLPGGGDRGSAPGTDARTSTPVEPAEGGPPPMESVEDAWDRFTETVRVRRPSATTPGEYARRAIESGAPETPVRRLTRLFRHVRYGGTAPTEERTAAAVEAVREITEDDE